MKRAAVLFIMISLICSLCSGCDFWMAGEYLSVKPHAAQNDTQKKEIIEVETYAQLRNVLADLVESGADGAIISIATLNEPTADFYINTAINYVTKNNAIGAYAVEKITYEIGTNRGVSVVAFQISYAHGRTEILQMQQAESKDAMTDAVITALDDSDTYLVMHTHNYDDIDFIQIVVDYANQNPDLIMEIPQVNIAVYPEKGLERVVELEFAYQTDREELKKMREQVKAVFTSAELYVKETTKVMDIYSRLYSFLMERNMYTIQTSITPAYSLLHHGVGDSRAFANVYAAMCVDAGLECMTISGTRDGTPWCWNLVRFRGKYYHIDLLRCSENHEFKIQAADEMYGYIWDHALYPET